MNYNGPNPCADQRQFKLHICSRNQSVSLGFLPRKYPSNFNLTCEQTLIPNWTLQHLTPLIVVDRELSQQSDPSLLPELLYKIGLLMGLKLNGMKKTRCLHMKHKVVLFPFTISGPYGPPKDRLSSALLSFCNRAVCAPRCYSHKWPLL